MSNFEQESSYYPEGESPAGSGVVDALIAYLESGSNVHIIMDTDIADEADQDRIDRLQAGGAKLIYPTNN